MKRAAMAMLLAATTLAACARQGEAPTHGPAPVPEAIRYETSPCFGACPVYAVTVSADGKGQFSGRRYTAVTGERAFTLTPAQYAAFARALAPWRPAKGDVRYESGKPNCQRMATDMPSVDVTWKPGTAAQQRLHFYFGCDMERNRAIAEALGHAPDALPIAALIGEVP